MCLIKSYLRYLLLELRYSLHTVKAYRTDLNIFNEYLNQNYDLSIQEANHSMIRSWLVEELNKGNSPRTVNRKITSLKSFFKYLIRENKIKINPTNRILSSKISKTLPQFIGVSDMNELLDKLQFAKE